MEKIKLIFVFACWAALSAAQAQVWTRVLDMPNDLTPQRHRLYTVGANLYYHADKIAHEINAEGVCTGRLAYQSALPDSLKATIWTDSRLRFLPGSGDKYLILAGRNSATGKTMLAEFRPGVGVTRVLVLSDLSDPTTSGRPFLVETADGAFAVILRNACVKVAHDPTSGFSKTGEIPLARQYISCVLHNGWFYGFTAQSAVAAFSENDGVEAWAVQAPFAVEDLCVSANGAGLLICGQNTDQQGAWARLGFDGVQGAIHVGEDRSYTAMVALQDGGVVLAGLYAQGQAGLSRYDASGQAIWRKTIPGIAAWRLMRAPNGGYLVLARRMMQPFTLLVQTDEAGETDPKSKTLETRFRRLETERYTAALFPSAIMFFDGTNPTFVYGDTAASIFMLGPVIYGVSQMDQILRLTWADFSFSNSPIKPGVGDGVSADFNRVWRVSRSEIEQFIRGRIDNAPVSQIPYDILTWPARGNPFFRYNLDMNSVATDPMRLPAPFHDSNGDGLYNPLDGDYPAIRGEQMIWWVMNDSGAPFKIGADYTFAVYYENCAGSADYETSLFVRFEMHNTSGRDYADAYVGFDTDFDLGCYMDDYGGSLPQADAYYVYNDNALDKCPIYTQWDWKTRIPVQSLSFLDKSLNSVTHWRGGANNRLGNSYNNLRGFWNDGTPLTTGGTGYNPGSTDFTTYVFDGNPADPDSWSMCNVNLGPADLRMTGAHGPFELPDGDTFAITLGLLLHRDVPHPCPDIYAEVAPRLAQFKALYQTGIFGGGDPILPPYVVLEPGATAVLDASQSWAESYLWSTGATTASIEITEPGLYAVTLSNAAGCARTETTWARVPLAEFPRPAPTPDWTPYPNPSSGEIRVQGLESEGRVTGVLSNVYGQAVLHATAPSPALLRMDASAQPGGIYLLRLMQGERDLGVRKILKR